MRAIVDLHIHSHYSRATSKEMNISSLSKWSQIKGTNLIGTGDFTHPRWFQELKTKLEPAESGLFQLKKKYKKEIQQEVPESCRTDMRFVPSVEISTIYKKNERVRKVHSLIIAPSFDYVAKINAHLARIGNIASDGRPILGLDAKRLLEIVLEVSEDCLYIPAHIWTPHFAVLGAASGFNSLEECYDELAPFVYAIETGLSSDPAMNWRIGELDNRAIISNSDAHSPQKLGREANIFNIEMSYPALFRAISTNDKTAFASTIEFYPEEGKYHLDGHRNCKTRLLPQETKKRKGLCPACNRKVTVGVMHRIDDVARRKPGYKPKKARPFRNIIPLAEIIAEVVGVRSTASKKVQAIYWRLIRALGNEFFILLDAPLKSIEAEAGTMLREAIARMRKGNVHIAPGYDGEYGTIDIFNKKEREQFMSEGQNALF